MSRYEFRYFASDPMTPAVEWSDLKGDGLARIRAVSELLRLPHRLAVEVWCGTALIYSHRRRPADPGQGFRPEP